MAVHKEQAEWHDEVRVDSIESKTSKTGRGYLLVQFSNGKQVFLFDPQKVRIKQGDFGVPEIVTEVKNDKTFLSLKSWSVTKPASTGKVTASGTVTPAPQDQAIWDAKDRGLDMQSAYKSAVRLNLPTDKEGKPDLTVLRAAAHLIYEDIQLARARRIATKIDPFADE